MAKAVDIISVGYNPDNWTFAAQVNLFVLILLGAAFIAAFGFRRMWKTWGLDELEINEAEFGIGSGKVTLKPNITDRQVAYAIWVELVTRKIGLPIDLENDVLVDIYDSWHSFFGVTRELIKSIPVSKMATESTRQIIRLSVEVLNEGLRPHLTMWQARFRHWFDRETAKPGADDPQQIQRRYPNFDPLAADLVAVNRRLIAYRRKLAEIVYRSDRQNVEPLKPSHASPLKNRERRDGSI